MGERGPRGSLVRESTVEYVQEPSRIGAGNPSSGAGVVPQMAAAEHGHSL